MRKDRRNLEDSKALPPQIIDPSGSIYYSKCFDIYIARLHYSRTWILPSRPYTIKLSTWHDEPSMLNTFGYALTNTVGVTSMPIETLKASCTHLARYRTAQIV